MCFSVISHASYENAESKWTPEIRHHCQHTPIILCGTKIDLRNHPETIKQLQAKGKKPLTVQDGEALSKKIGAVKYVECSAKERTGLKDVFDEAILAALYPPEIKKTSKCTLL